MWYLALQREIGKAKGIKLVLHPVYNMSDGADIALDCSECRIYSPPEVEIHPPTYGI